MRIPALLALVLLCLPLTLRAEEDPSSTCAVCERGAFSRVLEQKGTFVPRRIHEVSFDATEYGGDLEIIESVEGGPVRAGDVLLRLDAEPLEQKIREGRLALAVAETKLERKREEHDRLGAFVELELAQADLKRERAEMAFEQFRDIEMPMRIEQSEFSLRGSQIGIENMKEELEQLEKMYEEDDLTEETEDIVLKRTRRDLQRRLEAYRFTEHRHERLIEVELPQDLENHEMSVRKQRLDAERAHAVAAHRLREGELELEEARIQLQSKRRDLAELEGDIDALVLRAPVDGTAVPGTFRGQGWGKLDDSRRAVTPGRKVKPGQVLYSVLPEAPLDIRVYVDEADVLDVGPGDRALMRPTAMPGGSIEAVVLSVLPVASGDKFEVLLRTDKTDPRLMPGMHGSVHLTCTQESDVLVVPADHVRMEGGVAHVRVFSAEGVEERVVQIGGSCDGLTWIVSGLAEGERVLPQDADDDGDDDDGDDDDDDSDDEDEDDDA